MISDLPGLIDRTVEIKGWVDVIREHGRIIFLEIRDLSGTVQTVATSKNEKIFLLRGI